MTKKVKNVGIYKPTETASFEVGAKLSINGKETDIETTEISIKDDNTVEVKFSDKRTFVFRGFPISFEL